MNCRQFFGHVGTYAHIFAYKFKKKFSVINLKDLETFEANTIVNRELLKKAGIIRSLLWPVKVLGKGAVSKKLKVEASQFSKKALEGITQAGGEAVVVKEKHLIYKGAQ